VAVVLVGLALQGALRRGRYVALVFAMLAAEFGVVASLMRAFHLPLHVYDALVLPVLVGITIDEAVFLLFAGDSGGDADPVAASLAAQGPLVAATALTTSAGFAALLACRFDGLFDLGAVGALGSAAGLLSALIVVPAGLRLALPHGSGKTG
jgi:predicted RND superfamily exporter protein